MTSLRDFAGQVAGAGLGAASAARFPFGSGPCPVEATVPAFTGAPAVHRARVTPVVVSSDSGPAAVDRAMEVLAAGGDTLEAVVLGVNIVEGGETSLRDVGGVLERD